MYNLNILRCISVLFLCVLNISSGSTRIISNEVIQPKENNNLTVACEIYCNGPLLHTVQMAHLYQDSKTFVDMKLKNKPDQTLASFNAFMIAHNNQPTRDEVLGFVNEHFDDVGKEFVDWLPKDWVENPKFLSEITDPDLRQWGSDLNAIWKELGRQMTEEVFKNPDQYSIIPVPNPVIVPGGRFREFYYWDSYWIIRGLLYSEMFDTARGMIENFLSIVQRFGFIPNGGRIYYAQRSQPPLLASMVHSYVEFSENHQFGIDALDILEHEYEYWMNNHSIQIKGHDVCVYGDSSTGPRPESYREDVEAAEVYPSNDAKEHLYSELKAACESGMDFSSRWFIAPDGTNSGNLTNLKVRSIVPVELNAILSWNARIIAEFHSKAGNTAKAAEYEAKALKINEAIQAVHWNEEAGAWLDYDLINNKSRNYFAPTNLSPLWTKSFNQSNSQHIAERVLDYIKKLELDQYPGGVPNTLNQTGEQWDFPNIWPPMQYLLVEALYNAGTTEAQKLSASWGHRWVKSNFETYRETRQMYEKYNAEHFGGHGDGGEYEVQKGFGWSNGIIVEYLTRYGRDISISTNNGTDSNTSGVASVFSNNNRILRAIGVAFVAMLATTVTSYLW